MTMDHHEMRLFMSQPKFLTRKGNQMENQPTRAGRITSKASSRQRRRVLLLGEWALSQEPFHPKMIADSIRLMRIVHQQVSYF